MKAQNVSVEAPLPTLREFLRQNCIPLNLEESGAALSTAHYKSLSPGDSAYSFKVTSDPENPNIIEVNVETPPEQVPDWVMYVIDQYVTAMEPWGTPHVVVRYVYELPSSKKKRSHP